MQHESMWHRQLISASLQHKLCWKEAQCALGSMVPFRAFPSALNVRSSPRRPYAEGTLPVSWLQARRTYTSHVNPRSSKRGEHARRQDTRSAAQSRRRVA